jgi:hypothetical protein
VSVTDSVGWKKLIKGHPWFSGKGKYPIAAYSEFMPPPRLGCSPYDGLSDSIFAEGDLFGWYVSEVEEEHELQPGLSSLSDQIVEEIIKLGQGKPAYRISGH